MLHFLHITNNLNNNTETFIKNFIFELNSLESVNLMVYQRSNTTQDFRCIRVRTLKSLNFITKIKDKYLGFWDSQLNRFKRLGIKFNNSSSFDGVIVDYAVNAVDIFKNVNRIDIPVFVFVHGYDVSKAFRNKKYLKRFNELSKKNNVFFVSPCEFFMSKLRVSFNLDNNKLILLPYGVAKTNLNNFYNVPSNGLFKLLFVGRFVEKKNPLILVEVVRVLVDDLSVMNFQFVLVGDGPLFEEVKYKIERYKLQAYFTLKGSLSHSEVIEEMREAHLYIQHSVTDFDGDQEGLPNSILEAISVGLPVVSTIHSGIPEIVENSKTGFLVQEFDFRGMAEKLALLLNDMELYKRMREYIDNYRKRKLWSNKERAHNFLSKIENRDSLN